MGNPLLPSREQQIARNSDVKARVDAMHYSGDTFTIAGCKRVVRNPDRRWWQLWKPRQIVTAELQTWRVSGIGDEGPAPRRFP
jgi:hypothetical protein